MRKLKKKILKKANPLNFGIAILCIGIGYLIVSLFASLDNARSTQNPLKDISQSASRLADSFELYNQKKFMNSTALPESR